MSRSIEHLGRHHLIDQLKAFNTEYSSFREREVEMPVASPITRHNLFTVVQRALQDASDCYWIGGEYNELIGSSLGVSAREDLRRGQYGIFTAELVSIARYIEKGNRYMHAVHYPFYLRGDSLDVRKIESKNHIGRHDQGVEDQELNGQPHATDMELIAVTQILKNEMIDQ